MKKINTKVALSALAIAAMLTGPAFAKSHHQQVSQDNGSAAYSAAPGSDIPAYNATAASSALPIRTSTARSRSAKDRIAFGRCVLNGKAAPVGRPYSLLSLTPSGAVTAPNGIPPAME